MSITHPLDVETDGTEAELLASAQAAHARPGIGELLLARIIRLVDVFLRRWYGVREFSDDPACLLRMALGPAPHSVSLSDGTQVAEGEEVAILHIWNEHVPRFRLRGPDMRWALDIRRRLLRSFKELARHLREDPALAHIKGIHACVTFGSRRRRWQMRRAAARFGFDLIENGAPAQGLHELGDDMLIWVFTRAFNPAALRRQRFRRDRTELWISRNELLRRYG